jgi:hypothetical protein
MADPIYCPILLDAPCMKPEVWAAWVQAILSVIAIAAAERFASRRERKEVSRKADVYVNLISMAVFRCHSLGIFGPSDAQKLRIGISISEYQIRDMEQFSEAFRAIALQDVPDYRLLPPLRDAADVCHNLANKLKQISPSAPIPPNESSIPVIKLIKEAHWRLNECYLKASEVANDYAMPSLKKRWQELRLHFLARFSRPHS